MKKSEVTTEIKRAITEGREVIMGQGTNLSYSQFVNLVILAKRELGS